MEELCETHATGRMVRSRVLFALCLLLISAGASTMGVSVIPQLARGDTVTETEGSDEIDKVDPNWGYHQFDCGHITKGTWCQSANFKEIRWNQANCCEVDRDVCEKTIHPGSGNTVQQACGSGYVKGWNDCGDCWQYGLSAYNGLDNYGHFVQDQYKYKR